MKQPMPTSVEVNVDPALHADFREVLRNVKKQASVAHLVAYVWEAAIIAETRRAASAAPELTCKGCGGTIAQHDRLLRCRRDSPVQAADRLYAIVKRLLEAADSTCEQPPEYRRSALFRILDEAIPRSPVGWRIRGYSQFRRGTPTEWRYVDGPEPPKVNIREDCDIEPLYR